ncbi:hypothetical protein L3137_14890 [Bacillus sonorensis]|uniref:hypothetical protein n=1 Tax=Bacillus sonorensis TaxID=119858 RepID=UPI001F2ED42F|nr:hypothetical protein [Bacillus sonorensis]MCF7618540.1 hypothetical protein [Bacillus sonorensis]
MDKCLEWWGVTLTGNQKAVKALSELLDINKALFESFYKEQANTVEELVNKLYEHVPEHEKIFLNFVKEQLPNLRRYLQFELPNSPHFISSIEYEIYISSAEIDCYCPEDSRDCIISFFSKVLDLIDFIKNRGN